MFAERGFAGSSIDEICRRSGITAPVLYDHFPSKRALWDALVERHYAGMVSVWLEHVPGETDLGERLRRSFDAWFAYVEANPFALRLFEDRAPEEEVADTQLPAADAARAALLPLVAGEAPGNLDDFDDVAIELIWESVRAVLQTFARWRLQHREVPRERVVGLAIDILWTGFEGSLAARR